MQPIFLSDSGLAVFECYNGYYCEDKYFATYDEASEYFYNSLVAGEEVVISQ